MSYCKTPRREGRKPISLSTEGFAWRLLPLEPAHPIPSQPAPVESITQCQFPKFCLTTCTKNSHFRLMAYAGKSQPAAVTSQAAFLGFPQPSWKKEGRGKLRACTQHH